MFALLEGTVDQALEARREARRGRLRAIRTQQACLAQELTAIVRVADDEGDWRAAGYSSSEAWLARVTDSDHSTAKRIITTANALRDLPATDEAMKDGRLTLDQAAVVAKHATRETDAQLARLAVGKAPGEIARIALTLAPPKAADDQVLYERRALSLTWKSGKRELVFSGRLPLEQGVVFEQAIWDIATAQRAHDKKDGLVLEWQQSTADALVTLARHGDAGSGVRRSPTTLIVHLREDAPAVIEGAGPISRETADRLTCDARRLTIKPHGKDLVHSRVGRCASYPQQRALHNRSAHCQYPGCSATHELEAHHLQPVALGGKTELDNLILLCPRHHKLLHDHRIRTSGHGNEPVFTSATGRAITTNQPHAPPR